MKKIYFLFVSFILFFPVALQAQTPQFKKEQTTITSGIFLNSASAKKIQEWYNPGDLNSPASGNITTIYFKSSTANQSGTYSNFILSLKQPSAGTGFTGTTFETGLTPVFSNASFALSGSTVTNGWFSITLTTPFLYDNTLPLVFEMQYSAYTGGITTQAGSAGTTPYKKLYTATIAATTGTSHNAYWQDFGFDVVAAGSCSTPPVAGTATANFAAVCSGATVSLDLTGNSAGSGQTYQWQSSLTSGGTYTDIGSVLSSPATTVSAVSSLYYRCAVTCSGNTQYSAPVQVAVNPTFPGGTYTINAALPTDIGTGGTNFQSFTDAVSAISCGISSAIVFNVVANSGPYNEQVIIPSSLITSSTNTITINGNGNTLSYNSNDANNRAVIKLEGTDYVTINNLVIDGSAGTYGWGIHLTQQADHNLISGCTINVSTSNITSGNHYGIVISGSSTSPTTAGNNGSYNTISGNTINGGYYGIVAYGNSAAPFNTDNTISGNTIHDAYSYHIYLYGNENAVVSGNDISRPTRTSSTTTAGVFATTGTSNALIEGNRIHNLFDAMPASTSTNYSIYMAGDGAPGLENRIINNIVYNINHEGSTYGVYSTTAPYCNIYHNTFVFDNTGAAAGLAYGLYQTGTAAGIEFKNNIVFITKGGAGAKYGIYKATAANVVSSDNNVFYINSAGAGAQGIGYQTSAQTNLLAWQTATGQDANSTEGINPAFQSVISGNLTPTANIDDLGVFVGVTADINGAARSVTTPDVGAYEFTIGGCAAPPTAGTAVSSATGAVCFSAPVQLSLTGNSTGTGQTYSWESSATSSGTYTGISSPSSSASFTVNPLTSLYYRCAVTCSGQTTYSAPVLVTVNPGLFGTFTINAALPTDIISGGTNFHSFTDAVAALGCGMSGPVTLNVVANSGPYNEQVTITSAMTGSASIPLTINGNGETLSFNATNTSQRAGITLDGADYVTINNLVIDGTVGTYGWGVHLIHQADHNTISGCTINVSTTNTTSPNHIGIVISNSFTTYASTGNNGNYNTIINNTITGGYFGIVLYGTTAAPFNTGNVISNNSVKEVYAYYLYLYGHSDLIVSENNLSRPTRSGVTTTYGIYLNTYGNNVLIDKNRIHNMFDAATSSTAAIYCIYASADGAAGLENKIQNNLIYNIDHNGSAYGIYNTTAPYCNIYHNTISLDYAAATTGLAYGFYQTGTAAGIEFRNNILSISKGGTGAKYGIYKATAANVINSDNNVFHINSAGTGLQGVGYQGAQQANLLAWQSVTGGDMASIEDDPLFVQPSAGDYTPSASSVDGIGAALGVTSDITGNPRSATNPDPGAYEFSLGGCTTPPTPGTAQASALITCSGQQINFDLSGNSTGTGQTYTWESSPTGLPGSYTALSSALTNPSFSTIVTSSNYYRAAVTCNGNTQYATPVQVTVSTGFPGGVYTINSAQPTDIGTGGSNFQSFTHAASAMSCGIAGPIVLNVVAGTGPYNEQMILPAIGGTSASNTITINGNGNTINYESANTNERAVIKLNGTDYVTIDDLTINSMNGTYGYGVQLLNDADFNTVSNCTININQSSTSTTNYAGIVVNSTATAITTVGSSGCDNNMITGNTINGGYTGIAIVANGTNSMVSNNVVTGNTVKDFYEYGMYVNGNNSLLIEGNDLSRPNRTAVTTFRGIGLNGVSLSTNISKNRLHNPFGGAPASTAAAFNIYFNNCDASAGSENIVSNNLIYDHIGGTGNHNGVLNVSSDNVKYYHNTISLNDINAACTACAARGFYVQTAPVTGLEYKNNIVSITQGGTAAKQCIYFEGTGNVSFVSDNNDFHMGSTGGATNQIGWNNAAGYSLISDWQLATSQDGASVSTDPLFQSPLTGDLTPTAAIDNLGTYVGISSDILGNARNVTTPDIGAYEFSISGCGGTPVAGTATAPAGACPGANVLLSLSGYTTGTGITIQWESSVPGSGIWTPIAGATSAGYNVTGFSSATDYHAVVTCTNGSNSSISNTVSVSLNSFLFCYCTPVITSTGAAITNVTISGTTLNNTTTAAPPPYYVAYPATGSTTADLVQGTTYTINVTLAASGISSLWIDYNHSGTFDASEWVQIGTTGTAQTTSFTVSPTALTGQTGMRVRSRTTGANASGDPCTSMTTAEAEDYVIMISPMLPCTGTPVAGTASVTTSSGCAPTDVSLTLTGYTVASGLDIQWENYDAGSSSWVPVSGATGANTSISGVMSPTDYRAKVTCTNSGGSFAYSNTASMTVNNPQIINTVPGSRCGTGSVALLAQGSPATATVKWYDAPTGGNVLGTGNVFVTPSISSSTNYYAAAVTGGGLGSAGAPNNGQNTGYTLEAGLFFNVLTSSMTIVGVYVYPVGTGPGTVDIAVKDPAGVNMQVLTVNLTGTTAPGIQTYVPLNFAVPQGTGYSLVMLNRTGGVANLVRDPSASITGGGYPFTLPGVMSITSGRCCPSATSTSYYYFYNWQIATGCESARTQVAASVNGAPTGTGLSAGGTVVSANQPDGSTINYNDPCSEKVATVTDGSGGNILGNTGAVVITSPAVQTFNGAPYVPRVHDLAPASSGTATVSIYALQSEFNAYNAYVTGNNLGLPLLPTSSSDPAVSNIVVTQYHGGALAGTTGPAGLYNASQQQFIPNSSMTISWSGQYWVMTFQVTGFSGFFIHSGNGPLDIKLSSISAVNIEERNRVDWTSATEEHGDYFIIERSADGFTFTPLETINGKGASAYNYWDNTPLNGINYYRLQLMRQSGSYGYSKIVSAKLPGKSGVITVAPNPFTSYLDIHFNLQQDGIASIQLRDIQGRVILTHRQSIRKGYSQIKLDGLEKCASGVYQLSVEMGGIYYNEKVVK